MDTETEMEELLRGLLELLSCEEEACDEFDALALFDAEVSTFADAGLMTRNKGLVLRLAGGQEFQLTVVAR